MKIVKNPWLIFVGLLLFSSASLLLIEMPVAADSRPSVLVADSTVLTVQKQLKTDKSGENILLLARLTDKDSQPLGDRTVTFSEMQSFFGDSLIQLGSGITNAFGTTTFTYVPRQAGTHTIEVAFAGDESSLPSHVSISIEVSTVPPLQEPWAPLSLGPISHWVLLAVGAVAAIVWMLLVVVVLGVRRGVSHAVPGS